MLHIKAKDVDLKRMILVTSFEGSKTYSESVVPIADGLYPYIAKLMLAAHREGFKREDQLFNVNRFSRRHRRMEMDINQVEHFFKRLSGFCGTRITPHPPASFTRVLIERSEGTDWWHRLSGSASSARIAVE